MDRFCLPEDMSGAMTGNARRAAVAAVLVVLALVVVVGDATVSAANGVPAGRTAAPAVAQPPVARQAPAELGAVTAIAAGYGHSLALRSDRTVLAWGRNSEGQLGDGTFTNRSVPVRVCAVGEVAPCDRFLYGVRHIAANGYHRMAQLSSGGGGHPYPRVVRGVAGGVVMVR